MPTSQSTTRLRLRRLAAALLLAMILASVTPGRALAAGQPQALLNVPSTGFIGESLSFTLSFDNTHPSDPGYGPYLDLILPAAGVDGAGAAVDDGISFGGASYLGTPVTPVVPPFICAGSFIHPLTGLSTACTAGTQVVVLQPPYGSFTATQPQADLTISAAVSNLADLGAPLSIQARAGFFLGNDPLSNPATDPPIVQAALTGASFTPILWRLTKTYLGPEDETATGPNYQRKYRIDVDIANGQPIVDLELTDLLPPTLQFLAVDSVSAAVGSPIVTSVLTPSTTLPGGTLTRRLSGATGTTGAQDASMVFSFFVPRLDAASSPVLPAASGDDRIASNDARAAGTWDTIDGRDPNSLQTSDLTASDHLLEQQSIAIQKGAANLTDAVNTPGDSIAYTLDVQVSDYFAFADVGVTDVLSDGLRFDDSFAPTLACTEGGTTTSGTFATANYGVADNWSDLNGAAAPNPGLPTPPHSLDPATDDGRTTISFRLSDQLIALGADGQLLGGGIPAGGTGAGPLPNEPPMAFGATTCRIVYRASIQDRFSDTYPSGDDSVDQGDVLDNTALVDGAVLAVNNLTPTGEREADDTGAALVIGRGDLHKTIYAINGDTACPPGSCGGGAATVIKPGDTVTYRLQLTLPASDVEALRLADFLPLPIFDVQDTAAPVVSAITSFDPTVSAAPPPAGWAKFGPADDFTAESGIVPTLSLDPVANSVIFTYGSYDDPANDPNTIDLLFTVTASSDPFADKLLLTNQLRELETSTNAGDQVIDRIVQLTINEPELRIRKGVVASDAAYPAYTSTRLPAGVTVNPTAACAARLSGPAPVISSATVGTTLDSNLSGVDAGDRVTFAILVENLGSGPRGAFDVRVRDALPAGLTYEPGSLCVNLGANGAPLAYSTIGGGLFDPAGGIELADPGDPAATQGALGPGESRLTTAPINDGNNLALITFNATVNSGLGLSQALTNTATLYNYGSANGGADFTIADLSDQASVTTGVPVLTKYLVATSEAHTNGGNLAVGELVRYRMAARVPEGTFGVVSLLDALPTGLTFIDDGTARAAFVSNGPGISSTTLSGAGLSVGGNSATIANLPASSLGFALPDAAVSKSLSSDDDSYATGNDPYFILGTIANADNDPDDEYLVVEFNALVDNSIAGSNDAGETLDNRFRFYLNGSQLLATSGYVNLPIVEPQLALSKSVSPAAGDAGDSVTYTVVVQNASNPYASTAFDLALSDPLPAALTNPTLVSLTPSAGAVGASASFGGTTLNVSATSLAPGASITLVYSAELVTGVTPGQTITNTASLSYTSLPGPNGTTSNATGSATPGTPGSTTGERTGSGVAPNDHAISRTATVTVFEPEPVKRIVSTSEAHTAEGAPRPVVIGEIVRYRLEARLAEGASPALQLRDLLPPGLLFLDDGTARVAFVSNGGGIGSTTLSGPGLQVAGNEVTLAAIMPSFQLPPGSIGGGPFADGVDVTFSLGDLVNGDTDADREFVVVELNALVLNVAGNQAGTSLDNSFELRVGGTSRGSSTADASNSLVVHEPALSIDYTVTPSTANTGDTVTYTIVVQHTGGANANIAFDVALSNLLPATLTNPTLVSLTPSAGALGAGASFGGNTLTMSATSLAPGASITLVYSAELVAGITPGQTIVTTADVSYTSLPGSRGTATNPTGSATPDLPGSPVGERTGVGSGPNDHLASDPAAVTVTTPDLVLAKDDGQTEVTPGQSLVYTLTARNAGTGEATGVTLSETVPAHTSFDAAASSPGWSCADGAPAGTGCTFSLGSLAAGAQTGVQFAVRVVTPAPAGATTIANSASVADDGSNGPEPTPGNNSASDLDTLRAAPDLSIAKGDGGARAGQGDSVSYWLDYANVGDQAATGVVISETVPVYTSFDAAASTPGWSCADGAPAGSGCTFSLGSLAGGASGRISFAVRVANPLPAGAEELRNEASIADDGGNGADPTPGDNSASDTTPLDGAPDLNLAKDDGEQFVLAGQTLTYTLTVGNVGNQSATGVRIDDLVPANTSFVGASDGGSAAAGVVSWPAIDIAPGAVVTRTVTLRLDAPLPAGYAAVLNTATVADDGAGGPDPTPENNSAEDRDLVRPDLAIAKSDGGITARAGGVITYTLSYSNLGTVEATGVRLDEVVPFNTSFDAAASDPAWSCADGAAAETPCSLALGTLAPGASGSVAFAVRVDGALGPGVEAIDNMALIGDDGSAGADADAGDNSASARTPLAAAPDLNLAKDDGGATALPGRTIVYTLSYSNTGQQGATGVVLTETVPLHTSFSAGASAAGWSCADGAAAGSSCTLSLGTLAAGGHGSATFAVVIADPFPAGVTAIVNSALIGDDGANGPDPTPPTNSAGAISHLSPTAISLRSFTASRGADGVLVEWDTAAELNSWSFELFRSATGRWEDAEAVTARPILARGSAGGGAAYSWLDTTADSGVAYSYWLVEHEREGATSRYGPALVAAPPRPTTRYSVHLPLLLR